MSPSVTQPYTTRPRWREQGGGLRSLPLPTTNLGCDGSGPGLLPEQVHHVGGELTAGLVILLQLLTHQQYMINKLLINYDK
jgi:hypothetical protein